MIGPRLLTQEEFNDLPIDQMRSFHGAIDVKDQYGRYKEIDYRSFTNDVVYKFRCGK